MANLMKDARSDLSKCLVQVINLDRSTARLKRIASRLSGLGLDFQRLSAIDGAAVGLSGFTDSFDSDKWRAMHHRNPIASELACFQSHILAIEAFLDSEYEFTVILEDDAQLADSLPSALRDLEAAHET